MAVISGVEGDPTIDRTIIAKLEIEEWGHKRPLTLKEIAAILNAIQVTHKAAIRAIYLLQPSQTRERAAALVLDHGTFPSVLGVVTVMGLFSRKLDADLLQPSSIGQIQSKIASGEPLSDSFPLSPDMGDRLQEKAAHADPVTVADTFQGMFVRI